MTVVHVAVLEQGTVRLEGQIKHLGERLRKPVPSKPHFVAYPTSDPVIDWHANMVAEVIAGKVIGIAPFVHLTQFVLPTIVNMVLRCHGTKAEFLLRSLHAIRGDGLRSDGWNPHDIDVVNISQGGYFIDDVMRERLHAVIRDLEFRGIAVIVASGNDLTPAQWAMHPDFYRGPTSPARHGPGLTVGSCFDWEYPPSGKEWDREPGSMFGTADMSPPRPIPDVLAPADGVRYANCSLSHPNCEAGRPGGGTMRRCYSPDHAATSVATAVVTGVAARLLAEPPFSGRKRCRDRVYDLYDAIVGGCELIIHGGVPVLGQGAGVVNFGRSLALAVGQTPIPQHYRGRLP